MKGERFDFAAGHVVTTYCVAVAWVDKKGRKKPGAEHCVLTQHIFTVTGVNPLTEAEAVARAKTVATEEWDVSEYGPQADWRKCVHVVWWAATGPKGLVEDPRALPR